MVRERRPNWFRQFNTGDDGAVYSYSVQYDINANVSNTYTKSDFYIFLL